MNVLGVFSVVLFLFYQSYGEFVKKIAIVGGGLGGTSTAYYLRRNFQKNHPDVALELDVFEPYHIGGRLRNIQVGRHFYEAGGSIIHPANIYMQELAKKFGLEHVDTSGLTDRFGLFNGKEFVFTESQWGGLVTLMKMLRQYGWDVIRLQWHTKDMINRFSNIYNMQSEGISFESAEDLLSAMSPEFQEQLSVELNKTLLEKGFSARFIDELVSAALLVNYGQKTDIQTFVGSVALAGAESGLWSVKGGNEKVPAALLHHSEATVHEYKVTEVERNNDTGKYSILATATEGENAEQIFIDYDAVVLAFPLRKDRAPLRFSGVEYPEGSFGLFHRTVATFVRGEPRFSKWCSDVSDCPSSIMGCGENWNDFYNSLSLLAPVNYTKGMKLPAGSDRVWKVFSDAPLIAEQLRELFVKVHEKKEIPFLAYPEYKNSTQPKTLGFRLAQGLFYANAIEWAASAMEMSVIGGRNVALLVEKEIFGEKEKKSMKKEL